MVAWWGLGRWHSIVSGAGRNPRISARGNDRKSAGWNFGPRTARRPGPVRTADSASGSWWDDRGSVGRRRERSGRPRQRPGPLISAPGPVHLVGWTDHHWRRPDSEERQRLRPAAPNGRITWDA